MPTVRPDTAMISSPIRSAEAAGESGHDRPDDDAGGDRQLRHRGELGVGLGGGELLGVLLAHLVVGLAGREDLARGTTWRSSEPQARSICTNVRRSETATVVMLRCPDVGKVGRPSTVTTGAPPTSPRVS